MEKNIGIIKKRNIEKENNNKIRAPKSTPKPIFKDFIKSFVTEINIIIGIDKITKYNKVKKIISKFVILVHHDKHFCFCLTLGKPCKPLALFSGHTIAG